MQGLLEKLRSDAENMPDRVVYDFLDCSVEPFLHDRVTVGELYERACDIAAELRRRGAKPGDRAVIFSMQDKGTVFAVYGCMLAGVIFTVLPPPIDEGKIARFISVLKSCRAKFLISNAELEAGSDGKAKSELVKKAFLQAVTLRRVYTDRIPARREKGDCFHTFSPKDIVYLQYTSGSTSEPKGVMVSYGNLTACFELCDEIFHFVGMEENNLASWVPFYHNIGLVVAIFIPLLPKKGTSYFIPTLQFLHRPEIWPRVLADCRVNVTAAPNSAYDAIARLITPQKAAAYDLSHVTHLINGSEFVNARTVDQFCSRFSLPHNAFAPGYGLSECVCVATLASRDYRAVTVSPEAYREGRFVPVKGPGKEIVSVGRPAGDIRIAVIRADGTLCEPDEIGEVCLQGSGVCCGYWENPKESERFHTVIEGLPGEYYRTGDMGVMYDGCLYLTGRAKEMLILNGKNIFPGDIALLLAEQGMGASLEAVGVFSVLGKEGEQAVLCAECDEKAGFSVLASQINRIVAKAMGFSFSDIVFVRRGTLPRTDNRKIKTLETRSRYEKGTLQTLFCTKGTPPAETELPELSAVSPDASDEELRTLVRTAFQKLLPTASFGDDESFLELGGDSLRLMELVCGVEQSIGRETDLREIAVDPTVAGIAGYLGRFLRGETQEHFVDLAAECVLDETIRPEKEYLCAPEECHKVFLTGGTGFLGAYLIRSLMGRREKGIHVVCHVRAASPEAGMARIVKNMESYGIWQEEYRPFIEIVTGDLTLPRLGLSEEDWRRLTQECDLVIHNGALLNFVYPYERMKPANVGGTAETLRFACEGRAKYYHYISSYSVYDNPSHFGKDAPEDDPLLSPEGYFLGYSETKWVAEHLVAIARKRGLRTAVYRPGDITGTLGTGVWKLEDLVSRSLVGCIQMGCTPDVDVKLHLTPVDFVADAVTAIAFQSACVGKAFNLLNHTLMSQQEIARTMRELGYEAEPLPYDVWCARLAACPTDNVLRILSCLFTDRGTGAGLMERYSCDQPLYRTDNADALLKGSGVLCPPVDRTLLRSYLRHFAACGYIPEPKA